MRFRRTPSLNKKQKAALEEQIKLQPEREAELRKEDPRNTYKEYDDDNEFMVEVKPLEDSDLEVDIDKEAGRISIHTKEDGIYEVLAAQEADLAGMTEYRGKAARGRA